MNQIGINNEGLGPVWIGTMTVCGDKRDEITADTITPDTIGYKAETLEQFQVDRAIEPSADGGAFKEWARQRRTAPVVNCWAAIFTEVIRPPVQSAYVSRSYRSPKPSWYEYPGTSLAQLSLLQNQAVASKARRTQLG